MVIIIAVLKVIQAAKVVKDQLSKSRIYAVSHLCSLAVTRSLSLAVDDSSPLSTSRDSSQTNLLQLIVYIIITIMFITIIITIMILFIFLFIYFHLFYLCIIGLSLCILSIYSI